MKRARRTKILVEGDPALLARLASQVERNHAVHVVRPPETSLVMCRIRDSVAHQTFNLGEALITECTVRTDRTFGFGAVLGEDAEKAYRLAVVDAACRAGLPEVGTWTSLLEREERDVMRKQQAQHALTQRTRVQFDKLERG